METLRRWRTAGYSFISIHPAGDRHTAGEAVKRIAEARAEIFARPEEFIFVHTVADVTRAKREGKLGVGLHLEGSNPLEGDLAMLDVYYALGIRFIHPVFNLANAFGGGCADRRDGGLSQFGVDAVAEMNRLGMLVDGAHAGYETGMELIDLSSAPVIFSHHGCNAVHPHFRNVRDDLIKACAAKGGVIGISGAGFYLGGDPTPQRLFLHIDHVTQLVGAEHVGLGLDYVADADFLRNYIAARPKEWPGVEEGAWSPILFAPPEDTGALADLMSQNGYSDETVHDILGRNWLRVCEQVWK